jgi:hypothetical protein
VLHGYAFAAILKARNVALVHADESRELALGVALGLSGSFESGGKNVHIVCDSV